MGEINALTLDSIDFDNNVIHVSATISKGADNKSFVKEGTKTKTGIRDVPISNTLKPYLEEAIKRYKKNKENLIFFDHKTKKVITTNQVNCYYKRVCEAAGIESDSKSSISKKLKCHRRHYNQRSEDSGYSESKQCAIES